MKIASNVGDRKIIVKALEEETGYKAEYLHAPSFAYEIGPYIVDRAGDITVKEGTVDSELLSLLEAKELIRIDEDEPTNKEETIISLPMNGHDARSLRNLVFMIHSKGVLLSKAICRAGWFKASEKLTAELIDWKPTSLEEFFKILNAAGDGALQGITFEDEKISIHFPYTEDSDRIDVFMQLSTLMVKAARERNRVQPNKCKTTNEKYIFRVWLMHLGMVGEEYKKTRKMLLHGLKGHAAFRTKDQADAAREKLKREREKAMEAAAEMAFIRL